MKKLTSAMLLPNTIAILYFLLLPAISVSQLDLILHEVDPGYVANHIAEDFEGNTIICGNRFIGKLGTDSSWIWTTSIIPAEGSTGSAFILDMIGDGIGNTYLTGQFSQSVMFGSVMLTSLSNTLDLFVSKMDPDGNFLWAKSYGTSGGTDAGEGIALDASGNIHITGSFFNRNCSGGGPISPIPIRDIYIAKLNSAGNAIWQKRYPPTKFNCPNQGGANGGSGSEIKVDGAGNVIATGAFNGTIKFGNTTSLSLTSLGNGDIFTIKLNGSGTPLWAKAGRGTAAENSTSLYIDNTGSVLVGGFFGGLNNGSVTFSPFTLQDVDGNGTGNIGWVSNAFLVKYLSDGTVAWAVNPGTKTGIHNEVNGIISASENEAYISLPALGIKTVSLMNGTQVSFMEMEDNFFSLNGLVTEKMRITGMASSAYGYIGSLYGYCGNISIDNLTLANGTCIDCPSIYSCGGFSNADLFVIKSVTAPAVNSPIVNRSIPEILGHTYGGSLNGHSYYVSDCQTTWQQAQDAATHMGGYLVTITSEAEDEFVAGFAPVIFRDLNCEPGFFYGAWTGLRNLNNEQGIPIWQWTNGEPITYTNWTDYYCVESYPYHGATLVVGECANNCGGIDYLWSVTFNIVDRRYIIEFDGDPGCNQSNKTHVCHNGMTLCINESSLQNHLNHGDYAGPCGPCNSNNIIAPSGTSDYAVSNEVPISLSSNDQKDHFGKNTSSNLNFYPNPVSDEIRIWFPATNDVAMLRIFDVIGNLVYSEQILPGSASENITIDSDFGTGLHFIQFNSGNIVLTKPFMVENK